MLSASPATCPLTQHLPAIEHAERSLRSRDYQYDPALNKPQRFLPPRPASAKAVARRRQELSGQIRVLALQYDNIGRELDQLEAELADLFTPAA